MQGLTTSSLIDLMDLQDRLRRELVSYRGRDLVFVHWAEGWIARAHYVVVRAEPECIDWAEREAFALVREANVR